VKSRPIAVTGSRGFIGAAVVRALRDAGWETREYTSSQPFISTDGDLAEGLADCAVVVHLATRVNPKLAEEHPELVDSDREAFEKLIRGLTAGSRGTALVLPSSGGTVYAPECSPPYREEDPCRPVGAYGRLRLEFEDMLLRGVGASLPAAVLRISNVYGPGQRTGTGQGVVAHWMEAIRDGQPVQIFGNQSTRRDYVYVDDVATALVLAVEALVARQPIPTVVNVGAGRPTTLRELAIVLREVVGDQRVDVSEVAARAFDRRDTWLDVDLAARSLGWYPKTSLDVGLRRAWEATAGEVSAISNRARESEDADARPNRKLT
jgi:UDP-glucose 4-epimerase